MLSYLDSQKSLRQINGLRYLSRPSEVSLGREYHINLLCFPQFSFFFVGSNLGRTPLEDCSTATLRHGVRHAAPSSSAFIIITTTTTTSQHHYDHHNHNHNHYYVLNQLSFIFLPFFTSILDAVLQVSSISLMCRFLGLRPPPLTHPPQTMNLWLKKKSSFELPSVFTIHIFIY